MRYPLAFLLSILAATPTLADPLPGTQPLTDQADLAAQMVAGIDKYLMREIAASVEKRKQYWKPDFSSPEAYTKSVQPNRERLKKILGVVDQRLPAASMERVLTLMPDRKRGLLAANQTHFVLKFAVPVLPGVECEGLLLIPNGEQKHLANVIVIPDADWTPEMLAGLVPGVPAGAQFARVLAESGCRVIVPTLIDRKDTWSGNAQLGRMTNQTHREFIYRMAYQMGRHLIGYEVQKVLGIVDWLANDDENLPIGIIGYGEGGLLALYSAALDTRIQATIVSGYFGPREGLWREPIYRNLSGLLSEFGDSELIGLIFPRGLVIEQSEFAPIPSPSVRPGRSGAAPGTAAVSPTPQALEEMKRVLTTLAPEMKHRTTSFIVAIGIGGDATRLSNAPPGSERALAPFREVLGIASRKPENPGGGLSMNLVTKGDDERRQHRQFDQLVAYTQKLMRDSEARRAESFWAKLDTSSLEKYQTSTAPFRKQLWEEVLGKLPEPTEPMNPRSRLLYDEPKYKAYEVMLDLYPDVYAEGILCVPKDLKPGERRPVVVCQHGLEGRPTAVVNPKERTKYYNSFGSELANRGYVVFAPQNPYIGQDKFRVLQRKANPLGLSLFSFVIRQHERILDWLATQPFVDPERMAFYGLSYGGKTAMRVPAILPKYCLSICSGDFNEWTWKNVSIDYPGSYMFSGEYEMPEFNLAHTMVYAEMAALIAPRPFMVERGHDDGVGIDEWVAYEYAKVRRLYSKLKIPERTEIEFFAGGHEINGKGTFAFLDKHLKWTPR